MELKLSNTHLCALIDAEDLNNILAHSESWRVEYRMNALSESVVASISTRSKLIRKRISLARAILNYNGPLSVDHIDRNPLNNQKSNLRVVTRQQNNFNQGLRLSSKSPYKCVFRVAAKDNISKPWRVCVMANGKPHYGGYFATPEEAAFKANELLKLHHGDFAYQNIVG